MMRAAAAAAAALLLLVLIAAPAATAAPANGGVRAALSSQKLTAAAAMLDAIGLQEEQLPANLDLIILAPSDAAVAEFAKSMGLTQAQLLARPALVDSLVAYHMVPRARLGANGASLGLKAGGGVKAARSVDPSYVLRFALDGTGKQLTVKDVQGNVARVVAGPIPVAPVKASSGSSGGTQPRVELFVVDRVLLNGDVFLTPKAFLERHPGRFSAIAKLAGKADPALVKALARNDADVTIFLPNNAAVAAAEATLGKLSPAELKRVLDFHQVAGSRAIPYGFPANGAPVPTLLPGNALRVKASTSKVYEQATKRDVTFTSAEVVPDSGAPPARVTFDNVFAGRSTLQGIDRVLLPRGVPGAAAAGTSPATATKPATPTGRGWGDGLAPYPVPYGVPVAEPEYNDYEQNDCVNCPPYNPQG